MIKLYLIALPIFFLIDMVWLGFIAKGFYASHLGHLMRSDINWWAGILFYLLFIAGIVVFVVAPALENKSLAYAIMYGAFFGLISYATYDLTNLATLKQWPLLVTIIDLIWGSLLTASVSSLTFLISSKL